MSHDVLTTLCIAITCILLWLLYRRVVSLCRWYDDLELQIDMELRGWGPEEERKC